MTRKLILLAAVALATVGIAKAEVNVIETRQAGQDAMSGAFADIRTVVADKGDVKTLEAPAKAVARWLRQYPTLFPAGSDQGPPPTKALPAVWSDPAGFKKGADTAADAADKLAQLAKAGDTDGVAAQVKVVGDTCVACHKTYRAR